MAAARAKRYVIGDDLQAPVGEFGPATIDWLYQGFGASVSLQKDGRGPAWPIVWEDGEGVRNRILAGTTALSRESFEPGPSRLKLRSRR